MSTPTAAHHRPSDVPVAPAVSPRPLERLEAEIVELASQLTAATCRFLLLVGEYDAAEGWGSWGMRSTAQWLSWQCGVGERAGREQVRVARALRRFGLITQEFAAGRLSYSKVRAITRIATAETEATLVEWARSATAAQIERLSATQRRVIRAEDVRSRRTARYLDYRWDEDGSLVGSFRLPPEDAAVVLHALDAARGRLPGGSAEPLPDDDPPLVRSPAQSAADALTGISEAWLQRPTDPDTPMPESASRAELVVHASAEALARTDAADDASLDGVTLEVGAGLPPVRVHHATGRRLTCGCPARVQVEDSRGDPLHVGRRTRRIRGKLLAAVQRRDGGRCQAPGCTALATQIHHIRHWANGGPTCLPNLISLCDAHHWLVHEGGWRIGGQPDNGWQFYHRDGHLVPRVPEPRTVSRELTHDPTVRADAVTGIWGGEPLHLGDAIYCLNQGG